MSAHAAAALRRPGTPKDEARAVLLLVSPLADYVSGATLVVDGGSSSWMPRATPPRDLLRGGVMPMEPSGSS